MKTLLMGGQACVFYGAAEFSRDLDLLVLVEPDNLERLRAALSELEAKPVAIPQLRAEYLERGHAVHFRCALEDVAGLRIDVMSSLRGVEPFHVLWGRRTVISVEEDELDLLSLPDLVAAKKTQRDKDWPMIRRLVEGSYFSRTPEPDRMSVLFWLRELRSPDLLIQAAQTWPSIARNAAREREAVRFALLSDVAGVAESMQTEEAIQRSLDRVYWEPLRRELEQFRLDLRRGLSR